MSVAYVSETVSLPAESKLLKDAIVALVAGLAQKKSLVALALAELPALEQAVVGYQALTAEVKDPQEPVLGGLLAGQVISALAYPVVAAT